MATQISGMGSEVPPLESHVQIFFDQAGFSKTEAEKFYQHYKQKGWKGPKGYHIRNWKTKANEWLWELKMRNPHLRFK
jgi:hypothetical protein